MSNIEPLKPEDANETQSALLDQVKKKMGKVPNILGTMAHSPAVLQSYLSFKEALGKSSLSPKLQEQISLLVGEKNNCHYCVAAHTAVGKMAGLPEVETVLARKGDASDPKDKAALAFSARILETTGFVTADDLSAVRSAGWSDPEILEMVAVISVNIFTNLFNHVADTAIDFPEPPTLG